MLRSLAIALFATFVFVGTASAASFEESVVELTNQERAKHGLAALSISNELAASAERYAHVMAGVGGISHTGPDGSTLSTRNEAAGYRSWSWMGENVAAGQTSPERVVAAWMNSPGHRANILSPKAREIGVGHAHTGGNKYGHFWAQEFGARSGVAAQAPATHASQSIPAGNGCAFELGFLAIARQIPGVVGACTETEHHNPDNGDGLQRTAGGLLVWRKADNFTAFTNGHTTWVNGPYGLQTRLNSARFDWEAA